MEKPDRLLGAKQSIYKEDMLDDEAINLIMDPYENSKTMFANNAEKKADFYNHIHPNCLAFSDSGRLFAGGSDGIVSAWDIVIRDMTVKAENHFKIAHRELEGD